MATPVNVSYSAASGVTIYAGRLAAPGLPVYFAGKAVNEIFQIPNTVNGGSPGADHFSGWCITPNGEIFIAAAGGHAGTYDNRVVSCNVTLDAPAWVLRSPSSTVFAADVQYYADGKPSSSHLYHLIHWVPARNRVMLFGRRFTQPGGSMWPIVDGFDPAANGGLGLWDAAGTWPSFTGGQNGSGVIDANGDVWIANMGHKFTASTATWSDATTVFAANPVVYPWAAAPSYVFGLCYGNGESGGTPQVNAVKQVGTVQTQITFNASAALTQFATDNPGDCGMTYDPNNNRFLFYCGKGSGAGRVYVITPNAGTVWDMSILAVTGTAVATATGGVMSKFTYVPSLKAVIFLPAGTGNIHAMRVA